MTEKQALTAARKRWGERAHVRKHRKPDIMGNTHHVGYIMGGIMFMVEGSGTSWAEAVERLRVRGWRATS